MGYIHRWSRFAMNPRTTYFILKAIRLTILCAGLALVVLAESSVFTASNRIPSPNFNPSPAVDNSTVRLNINNATLKELMDLPTIGQVIGSRIIEYRQQHGPFKRPSDIIIIKGISEHKFRQLEDLITAE